MNSHCDCVNFIPIDVAKGTCVHFNETVMIDSATCVKFSSAPKCRFCCNFKNPDAQRIGTCEGFEQESWVSSDFSSMNCEKYTERKG
ncbi:MAG: 4-hydroxyphenylacetate decarboxylase small subunit [Candidatus Riflebacteria bacterium]|nr:4-hydroxyphenylacetate decarboxylase small subunit [Candidatus Riflebacteria bacterium]